MPRTKIVVTLCVAFITLSLGATIIARKRIDIWLNSPLDPGRAERRLSRDLVKSQFDCIHAALVNYAIHNNSCLPPMKNIVEVQKALRPYTIDNSIFISSVTKHPFQPNVSLSNHRMNNIAHPSQVIAFYDIHPKDAGYDKREPVSYPQVDIMFLNGDFATISSYDWPKYQLASKIPR